MEIKMTDINGITLKTAGKQCAEDIFVSFDVPKYDGVAVNGYTITLTTNSYSGDEWPTTTDTLYYSIDNGESWVSFNSGEEIVISEVMQIKFKIDQYDRELIISKTDGVHDGTLTILDYDVSENLLITEDTTLYLTLLNTHVSSGGSHSGPAPD